MTALNIRHAVLAAALLACSAPPLHAQRLLDWTVRTHAGAEALTRGAGAVFWNPGSIALDSGRIEALVLDMQGPSTTGLNGAAVSGVAQLTQGTSVGLGFQHLDVGGIPITNDSPVTDALGAEIRIAEDRFTLAGAQPINAQTAAGAMVQFVRANDGSSSSNEVEFGAGFAYRGHSALRPSLGAAAFVGGETRWIGGVAVTPLQLAAQRLRLGAGYGISGGDRQSQPSHRGTLTASWLGLANVTAGVLADPGADGTTLQPVVSADLRLGRYLLGVLREGLPNGFGAMYSYRLNVRF
jgi:hypothetical protein